MTDTPGQKLRKLREEQNLSLKAVSDQLHIRTTYLSALEADQLEQIPSLTQARGFLRTYAKYLGLPPEQLRDPSQSSEKYLDEEQETSPQPSAYDAASYHLIFKEIGETLRHRREVLGLSRDDIEAHTHIPVHYVDYIETGAFDSFPSPAQARGMLSNYTHFLDTNPDAIMGKYAKALQTSLSQRRALPSRSEETKEVPRPKKQPPKVPQWVRMFLSPDLILITTVGIMVVVLTIWGIGRVTRTQAEMAPQPTAPSLVEALLPTSTTAPTETPTPEVSTGGELLEVDAPVVEDTAIPTVQIAGGSSLQVFIIVRQRTYLHVIVDGTVAYDGRTSPNDNLTFTGQQEIRLLTGNAAALQIFFNDQDQGVLGIFGEVAEVIYTRDGVVRPTKVPTLTPEVTETPTPILEPTATESGPNLPPEQNTPVP